MLYDKVDRELLVNSAYSERPLLYEQKGVMEKMKIGWIVPGFSRDETHWAIPVLQTLAMQISLTHELHVFSLRYPEQGEFRLGAVRHHALGGHQTGLGSARLWGEGVRRVLAEHRQRPFNLLHAFWADEPGLVATVAGRLMQRPSLVSLGGGELVYLPNIGYGTQRSLMRRGIIRLALRLASGVTAGSPYQLAQTAVFVPLAHKRHLVPLGVDTTQFQPAATPPTQPTLVQAASLVSVKNQALLLRVLARVRQQIPQVRLILAGEGPLAAELRAQAADLGLSEAIVWRQKVAYEAMTAVYQAAHLYVQTSWHESQGMAVLEAMACGLPVVGTPVGVVREVACLPASWQEEVLAEQATAVLQGRVPYPNPRAIVQSQFSLPVATARFLQLYAEI